jgi:hypothetical protein
LVVTGTKRREASAHRAEEGEKLGTLADRIGTSYAREAVRPRNGGAVFEYRLYLEDGSEVEEAAYTQHIKVGEIVWAAGTRQFRVVDVVPVEEEGSPYVGLLEVEAV